MGYFKRELIKAAVALIVLGGVYGYTQLETAPQGAQDERVKPSVPRGIAHRVGSLKRSGDRIREQFDKQG